jgi:hypothetical protein
MIRKTLEITYNRPGSFPPQVIRLLLDQLSCADRGKDAPLFAPPWKEIDSSQDDPGILFIQASAAAILEFAVRQNNKESDWVGRIANDLAQVGFGKPGYPNHAAAYSASTIRKWRRECQDGSHPRADVFRSQLKKMGSNEDNFIGNLLSPNEEPHARELKALCYFYQGSSINERGDETCGRTKRGAKLLRRSGVPDCSGLAMQDLLAMTLRKFPEWIFRDRGPDRLANARLRPVTPSSLLARNGTRVNHGGRWKWPKGPGRPFIHGHILTEMDEEFARDMWCFRPLRGRHQSSDEAKLAVPTPSAPQPR